MKYEFIGELMVPNSQAYTIYHIRPNFRNGPWIAGGAVRQWLNGEEVTSDVDIYVKDEKQKLYLRDRFDAAGWDQYFTSSNALTFKSPRNEDKMADIQIIVKEYHKTPQAVLQTFDFAQCQLITDGYEVYGNPLWRKTELTLDKFRPDHLIKRFIKYYSYGYDVKPGTLKEWAKNKELNYNFSGDGDGY